MSVFPVLFIDKGVFVCLPSHIDVVPTEGKITLGPRGAAVIINQDRGVYCVLREDYIQHMLLTEGLITYYRVNESGVGILCGEQVVSKEDLLRAEGACQMLQVLSSFVPEVENVGTNDVKITGDGSDDPDKNCQGGVE